MRLIIEQGDLAGRVIPLTASEVVIGRGEASDFVLAEHGVSRRHARLRQTPQGWTLTDLGSTNGTFVNERQLGGHQSYLLRPGDRIRMGSAVLAVRETKTPDALPEEGPRPGVSARSKPHPALLIAGALAVIVVLVG
ncbi:MAG: FHA domain-containing protein, partial [Anaerolineae bacterium]